jgi:multidrug resistance protein, MATE family
MRGEGGRREVAGLAWPLAVGMLSFTVMGVTDMILIGHVGTYAQAGVGLGVTFVFLVVAFFRGVTSGAQSLVAAADGAGNQTRVLRAAGAALIIGLITGLMAAVAGVIVTHYGLPLVTDEADVLATASDYLMIRSFALPLSVVSFGIMSVLQGLGDTRIRMWASIAGNATNIVLDFILIFGWGPIPPMGAAGAALATVAGVVVMLMMYAWRFKYVVGRPLVPTREVLRSTIEVGLPAGAQAGLGTLAFSAMTVVLAKVGAAHLAASQIALNIISVSFLPGYGLGEAAGVLAGRYIGAGKPRTAARAIRSARDMALLVMGACGVLFCLAGTAIVSVFTQDTEVALIAESLLLCAAVFQLFDAVVMVNLCALRNVGDTRFTFFATSFAAWFIMVPLTYYLGLQLQLGATGAWCAMIVEFMVLAVITGSRVRGIKDGRVGRLDLLLGQ